MSMQFSVRFYEKFPESEYESNLLPHCFDLFEGIKDLLGVNNFLAVPFTINEEELYAQIEAALGGEPDEDDEDSFDEFEENIEKELALRGAFFPLADLRQSIVAYREYFQSKSGETFDLSHNRRADGKRIAEDLGDLQQELERLPDGQARFVIG